MAGIAENRYLLRLYGLPRVEDEEHAGERSAIDSARKHLKDGRERGFAEVRDQLTAGIVWTGYLTDTGAIKEGYEREPGSDDA